MLVLISILLASSVALLCYWLLGLTPETDPQVEQRLKRYSLKAEPAVEQPRLVTRLARTLVGFFEERGWGQALDKELEQADIPLKGAEFVVLVLILTATSCWLFWVLDRVQLLPLGLLSGLLIPKLILRRKIQQRSIQLSNQVAGTITLLSNSLKAGYSFLQSLELVSREMPPPISQEFARVVKEISLGADVEATLQALGKRAGNADLDLVLTAVQIQRQVGGNLSEILDTIAVTIRERVRIKGELKTLTAQGRISGVVVMLLPLVLGLIIYLLNPAYVSLLFTTQPGRYLLVAGTVSQLIGILLIRRIVNIEV